MTGETPTEARIIKAGKELAAAYALSDEEGIRRVRAALEALAEAEGKPRFTYTQNASPGMGA